MAMRDIGRGPARYRRKGDLASGLADMRRQLGGDPGRRIRARVYSSVAGDLRKNGIAPPSYLLGGKNQRREESVSLGSKRLLSERKSRATARGKTTRATAAGRLRQQARDTIAADKGWVEEGSKLPIYAMTAEQKRFFRSQNLLPNARARRDREWAGSQGMFSFSEATPGSAPVPGRDPATGGAQPSTQPTSDRDLERIIAEIFRKQRAAIAG